MFFYLVYAAMFMSSRWVRVAAIVVPIMLSIGLIQQSACLDPATVARTGECNALLYQFPPTRLIEFLAGVALYRFRLYVPQVIGLAACLAVFFGYLPAPPSSVASRPDLMFLLGEVEIIVGGGALIASLAREGWLSRLLAIRPLVIGGEISYAMYMTHQIVNILVLPNVKDWTPAPTFALVTTLTILASVGLFYLVENPVRIAVKARIHGYRSSRREVICPVNI